MKKIIGLFAALAVFYNAQTQQVTKEFNRLLVDDDFSNLAGKWNQQSNADNLFIGTERGFQVWRKNAKSGFFLLPEKAEVFSVFEATAQFTFEPGTKAQSAGIILQGQADGSGALIVEINRKHQFRIRRTANNRTTSLTGEGEGWVRSKKTITTGLNQIMVRTYDKIYDLYINGTFVHSFTEIEYSEGQIGIYIGAGSKVTFSRLSVKTDDDHANQKGNDKGPVDEEKTLAQIIVKLKESINKKDKRIQELEAEVRSANGRGGYDTALVRQKNEVEDKWLKCTRELETLRAERESLLAKVESLEEFKKMIRESENGDVIINLTKLSATQKEQIASLQAKNNAQAQAIEQLKLEKLELEKQLKAKTALVDEYQNNEVLLKQKLIEKDSIITALLEKVRVLNDSLTECNNQAKKSDSAPDRKKKRKEKKKEDPPLFDE